MVWSWDGGGIKGSKVVETGLEGLNMLVDLEKPRRCCFQINKEGGRIFVSVLNMNRPFTVMKAMDMGWSFMIYY